MEINSSDKSNEQRAFIGNIALVLIKTIAYLLVIIVAIFLGLGLMSILLPEKSIAALASTDFYDWQSLNIQYLGITIGVLGSTLIFRRFVDKKDYRSMGMGTDQLGSNLGIGILWAIGILSIAFASVWLGGGIKILGTQELGIALLGYLSFFLLVAILEEVICRGYLLQMATDHLNYKAGIALSALIFTLAHLGNDHFTWIAFCNLSLGGILMSLLYLKYRSLYVPIGFHWLWNYFQGNILGFGVSGTDVLGILQIDNIGPNWLSGGQFGLEGSIYTCVLLVAAILYIWINSKTQFEAITWKKSLGPAIA